MFSLSLSSKGTHFVLKPLDAVALVPAVMQKADWYPSTFIPGAWMSPVTPTQFRRLTRIMPETNLTVSDEVLSWMRRAEIDSSLLAATAPVAEPIRLTLNTRTRAWQERTVQYLATHRRALASVAPGLGKTNIAIQAANNLSAKKILVVCPTTLIDLWIHEIFQWSHLQPSVTRWHGDEVTTVGAPTPEIRFVVTNYETIVKQMRTDSTATLKMIEGGFDTLILDESIMVKNRETHRGKNILQLARPFRNVWLLSGAPTSRHLDDIWHQLHILDKQRFPSYWGFAYKYCVVEKSQWGTSVVGTQPDGVERLQKDAADYIFSVGYDSPDVQIPEWEFAEIPVTIDGEQWSSYSQMAEEFMVELLEAEDGDEYLRAANTVAKMVRLNQIQSNPALVGAAGEAAKWDKLKEILADEMTEYPIIVWTAYIQTAVALEKYLRSQNVVTASLTGKTDQKERVKIAREFQDGKIQVLVAHPGVGKYGLTLTKARTSIYLERTFLGDDWYQSLFRVRRLTTTAPPKVVILLATGPEGQPTMDWLIHMSLSYKSNTARQLSREMVMQTLKSQTIYQLRASMDEDDSPEPPAAATPVVEEAVTPEGEEPPAADTGKLQYGYFTIVDWEGKHRTVRITPWKAKPGLKVMSLLTGPDNTKDYRMIAVVDENDNVSPTKSARQDAAVTKLVKMLLGSNMEELGYAYALASGNCWRCGRLLTVPASIHRGLGPVCAGKE